MDRQPQPDLAIVLTTSSMPLALLRSLQVTSIMKRYISSVLLLLIALTSPVFAGSKSAIQERADRFLALANAGYQAVYRVNSEAQWNGRHRRHAGARCRSGGDG